MDNPRQEKVAIVAEVKDRLEASQAVVLTEYRGLDVAAMAELRNQLRAAGGTYKIYKNTLVRFAARDLGLELDELLIGPTAIAFAEGDAAAMAKALRDYARANPTLVVKGGILGDRLVDADGIKALADLPPREQLLAEIAGLFAAPMQQLAGLLDAVPRNFAYALQALIDAGGAPGAPAETPADETPAAEAADETPVAEAADETPAEPSADETPAEPSADETPAADDAASQEES